MFVIYRSRGWFTIFRVKFSSKSSEKLRARTSPREVDGAREIRENFFKSFSMLVATLLIKLIEWMLTGKVDTYEAKHIKRTRKLWTPFQAKFSEQFIEYSNELWFLLMPNDDEKSFHFQPIIIVSVEFAFY